MKIDQNKPDISVIMTVFNSEEYLSDAIESIIHQTYRNYEYIIVDDGSTDKSRDIIDYYASQDQRIIVLGNEHNSGIPFSANKALEIAQGKYISRMDADDIALPLKLEEQYNFMERNPKIILSGTWAEQIDINNNHQNTLQPACDNNKLKTLILFHNTFINSSSIFKRDIVVNSIGGYNLEHIVAQDYGLWVKLAKMGEFANIPKVLLKYRWHDKNVSNAREKLQKATTFNISFNALNEAMNGKLDKDSYHRFWYYWVINNGIPSVSDINNLDNMFKYASKLPHAPEALFTSWLESSMKLMREGHIVTGLFLEYKLKKYAKLYCCWNDKIVALSIGIKKIILYILKKPLNLLLPSQK